MGRYTRYFDEIAITSLPDVGGKCASLGEMSRAGFPVPKGFCITTSAYRDFIASSHEMDEFLDLLDNLPLDRIEEIRLLGMQIRDHLQSIAMPKEIESDIMDAWKRSGEDQSYAIRSSATAEDLPTASFAGQQETYLNVKGAAQLLQAVQKCWASLFTDRAIIYRAKNGFDNRSVYLSVVVQQMVFPDVSGIMFTADPVSGHRHIISIDASFGIGEALVSGIVSGDLYKVRRSLIVEKKISEKKKAIYPAPGGGTEAKDLPAAMQIKQALPDEKVMELAELGLRIEEHYGSEQDIEWCLAGDKFFILQSRPITSLYPVPDAGDGKFHVFFSFAHMQMMVDAMRPLAISVWRTLIPFGKDSATSYSPIISGAGGRLFIDGTAFLYWRPTRRFFYSKINILDELMADAISKVMTSEDFLQCEGEYRNAGRQVLSLFRPVLPLYTSLIPRLIYSMAFWDPSNITERAMSSLEKAVGHYESSIMRASGPERIKSIQESIGSSMISSLKDCLSDVPLGFIALPLASRLTRQWLGKDFDVDALSKSLPGNVTSELGLMIGDLADVARMHPDVVRYLEGAKGSTFYQGLSEVKGGDVFKAELDRFMDRYGMRCPGEIDITNVRWREAPTLLMPSILGHIKSNAPGEHRERFRQGQKVAEGAVRDVLESIRTTPGGYAKSRLMSRLLSIYRNSAGLRELPKYGIVRFFGIYRQAILKEAGSLCRRGVLSEEEDVFYLSLSELVALLENQFSGSVERLVQSRKIAYAHYQKLTPPRVITSEGEVFTGIRSGAFAPEGALVGTPVSAGVAEGYVKVVLRPEEATLKKGDVLVAPFTDPGWTPLFQSARALVVEVGGTMTHGSVIAREYGIPAVVGIENVTRILKDGQRVRVDGTRGFVQMLNENQLS
jgi:phosphoenolpyruvate synthase/pyruvate phosphate dikinase